MHCSEYREQAIGVAFSCCNHERGHGLMVAHTELPERGRARLQLNKQGEQNIKSPIAAGQKNGCVAVGIKLVGL